MALGQVIGQYTADLTTGVLAATLAADAPIFALRCGPTQTDAALPGGTGNSIGSTKRRIYVTEIGLKVSGVTAFTAIQQFGFYLGRFSAANMAGGAAVVPLKAEVSMPASVALSGGGEGGDCRASTTAALTTAGVTIDTTVKQTIYGWTAVGPIELEHVVLDFRTDPIELDLGEGLALFNKVVWPAAGTAVVTGYIKFEEHTVF